MKLEKNTQKKKQTFVVMDSMLANTRWMYLIIILLQIPDIVKLILKRTIRNHMMIVRELGRKFP